ncbi:TATA element modulatory factor [Podospora conica]|nr:TATA element modulatory factor [Schizothecium conicum]
MAAPTKKTGWGSFLSQAVGGLEARLDNILAEDDGSATKDAKTTAGSAAPPNPPSPSKKTASPGPSRTSSTARTNDRLQERLARAIAAKAAGQKADTGTPSISNQGSPRASLDAPSRASLDSFDRGGSPALKDSEASPRPSQDVSRLSQDASSAVVDAQPDTRNGDGGEESTVREANGAKTSTDDPSPIPALTKSDSAIQAKAEDVVEPTNQQSSADIGEDQPKEADKAQEDALLQRQEEIHAYVERIDALESKLKYMAKEAMDSAKAASSTASPGSLEKKKAEADLQIAQLMEEGINLARTEQKHRAILKRLRGKISEDEREINALKTTKEKSDREAEALRQRAKRADELEKTYGDLQRRLDQAQRDLSSLRSDVRSKDSMIVELKSQLQKATEQADAMAARVNDQAREQDRRRIAELEESVAALQVEKNLVADRAKIQATELKEKAEKAAERARALELELKAEVQVMESKLEAMRSRAEEVSTSVTGDSQAKLLRQVETLQTQYSIASENWHGIEATLLARITNLERERDEALQRESDMRKKAREAALRAKRNEEELEEAKTKLPNIEEDVKTYKTQIDRLKKRAEEAEAALQKTRAEAEKQKQAWEAEKEERNTPQPNERRTWLEDLPGGPFLKSDSRPESPQLPTPGRTFSTDFLGIQSLTGKLRKASAPSTTSEAGGVGDASVGRAGSGHRRPSAQPPIRPTIQSTVGSLSGLFSPSVPMFSPSIEALQTPSLTHAPDRDDAFDGFERSSSPQQVMQDMVSVSTAGAGPSVQLVERMSAAIRRLESEKMAAREELGRISRQRDEARSEIVTLMREAEGGKEALRRVAELEAEVAEVSARYETTLELLGEKSEMVEELKADVDDVKTMYRELVERTIK